MSEFRTLPLQVAALLALTGQRLPIMQAPIGSAATPALAAAVARAGGLGGLALTWTDAHEAAAQVKALRDRAEGGSFFANFVLHFACDSLDSVLDAGVPVVTFSWGIDAGRIARAHRAGAVVGVQVGNTQGARNAVDAGADFLIVQGIEAGGHVQGTTPLAALLSGVLSAAGTCPVVAAGGIASGSAIAGVIATGAAGAMMGTRFVATSESGAHDAYKSALVAAQPEDTAFTNCFNLGWPHAMHRVLRNSTFTDWETAGCTQPPNRPGEGDILFRQGGQDIVRYSDTPPGLDAVGDVRSACLYAGTGVGEIRAVEDAGHLVARLEAELVAGLADLADKGAPG